MKTIFVAIVTALVTIILMKNTDEVMFWIFGNMYISKLAILGVMFGLGLFTGILIARPSSKRRSDDEYADITENKTNSLSEEDKEYLS